VPNPIKKAAKRIARKAVNQNPVVKAGRKVGKAVKTGVSPVTFIPRTAAKGYRKTTQALNKARRTKA